MNEAIAVNIAVLFVFILVVVLTTAPHKSDTAVTKTMKRLARHTLTATLLCAVTLGLFALWVVKSGHQ